MAGFFSQEERIELDELVYDLGFNCPKAIYQRAILCFSAIACILFRTSKGSLEVYDEAKIEMSLKMFLNYFFVTI